MPIIINGGSRRAGGWWSKHLENKATNARVEVVEIVGLSATTLTDAFREMHAVSRGTKCENYFYQANINPRADEQLTPEQWRKAVDTLEKNLGLTGQPRFVVEHEKEGRTHRHVVWSRIDTEQMRAIPDSLTAAIHERTSRELEISFDLERGRSILIPDRDFDRPERRPKKHETFRALDSGIDAQTVKAEVSALWRSADNAHSFKAALEASGYVLARGDRRDFVIIDRAGDDHSLARRAGVKAAELRERMKEIDPAGLPNVVEARAQQRAAIEAERAPSHGRDAADAPAIVKDDAARAQEGRQQPEAAERAGKDRTAARGRYAGLQPEEPGPAAKAERPLGKVAGAIRTAWSLSRTATELEEALAVHGISLAQVDPEEAYASERRAAFAKATGHFRPAWREGEIVAVDGRGTVYRLNERTTGDTHAEIEGRLVGVDRAALMNLADTKEVMRAAVLEIWKSERQAERERARPANWVEHRIAECAWLARISGASIQQDAAGNRVSRVEALADRISLDGERHTVMATVHGPEAFAARLDDAGIAIARVTEADVRALGVLRHDENMARLAAEANREAYRGNHFAELEVGKLAAVTRAGDVYSINPDKLGDAAHHIAGDLPSVTEIRARFEIEQEQTAAVWAQHRIDVSALRQERAAEHEQWAARETAAPALDNEGIRSPGSSGGRLLGGLANVVTAVLSGVFEFLVGGPPKLTVQQVEDRAKAESNLETQHARNVAAEMRANDTERHWQRVTEKSQPQEQDLSFAERFGRPPTTHEIHRERERERD